MLSTKKTIKTIGKSVELSGHIVLLAAAVVGLFAIPLALAAADSKNKKETQNQSSSQPTTVINNYHNNNTYFFGNPLGCGSRSTASWVSPEEFLNGLLIYSLVSSTIGIALSLCLGVPWVACLVGGLWLAGVGLAKLGEQIVSYAKQMPATFYAPQEPAPEASAPPLEPEEDPRLHKPSAPPLVPGEDPWLYKLIGQSSSIKASF